MLWTACRQFFATRTYLNTEPNIHSLRLVLFHALSYLNLALDSCANAFYSIIVIKMQNTHEIAGGMHVVVQVNEHEVYTDAFLAYSASFMVGLDRYTFFFKTISLVHEYFIRVLLPTEVLDFENKMTDRCITSNTCHVSVVTQNNILDLEKFRTNMYVFF